MCREGVQGGSAGGRCREGVKGGGSGRIARRRCRKEVLVGL